MRGIPNLRQEFSLGLFRENCVQMWLSRTFILQVGRVEESRRKEEGTVFLAELRNSRGEHVLLDTIARIPSKMAHVLSTNAERSSFSLCPVLTAAAMRLVVSVHVPPSMAPKKFDRTSNILTVARASIQPLARQHVLLARVDNFTVHVCRTVLFTSSLFLLPRNSASVVPKANDRDAGRGSIPTQCAPHVSATPSTRITTSERSTVKCVKGDNEEREGLGATFPQAVLEFALVRYACGDQDHVLDAGNADGRPC